jgi:hypothetical protein
LQKGDEAMNDASTDSAHDAEQSSIQAARQTAVRRLAQQAIGSLTLDEYAERALAVEQAETPDEIDAALQGLPEETDAVAPARHGRWLVAAFGGTEQRGRWRLSSRLRIVSVFGGVDVDLGAAEPEAPESVITVVAILGGAGIIAPQGVPIQLSGFSLLGGKGDKRSGGPPLPGAPLVRVRVFTILGGVTVKDRPARRNLLDVIRARRSKTTRD